MLQTLAALVRAAGVRRSSEPGPSAARLGNPQPLEGCFASTRSSPPSSQPVRAAW